MPDAGTGTSDLDTLTAQAAKTLSSGAPDESAPVTALIKRLKTIDASEQSDPTLKKLKKQVGADEDDATEKAAGVKPIDVKPWDANKETADRQTDPLKTFGSAASIFGILASAFTHQPMENALNASAAAFNAVRAGDEKAYQNAYDAWKQNTQLAIERHKEQHEAFTDAMEKLQVDPSIMRTYSAQYGDQRASVLSEAGLYQNLASMGAARQSAALQIMQAVPELEKKNDQIQAFFAFKNAKTPEDRAAAEENLKNLSRTGIVPASTIGKWDIVTDPGKKDAAGNPVQYRYNTATFEATTLTGEPYTPTGAQKLGSGNQGVITDDAATFAAERILKGDPTATVGLARSAASMAKIDNRLTELAAQRHIDAGTLMAAKATIKADSSSLSSITKMTDAAVSFEKTANDNFDLALKRGAQAIPTNWGPFLNRWIENGETALGDKDVPAYVTAMLTGANEYAKIMSGSTGAQGSTVDSRREAAQLFSPYLARGQIEEVVKVAKQDMQNREKRLTGQIDYIKGRIRGDNQKPEDIGSPDNGGVPAGAPTATGPGGKKVYFDGSSWVPAGGAQ